MGKHADTSKDYFRIANWSEYQHYKDRNPSWIKLHFSILSSESWVMLDDASRVLAIACMLVASRDKTLQGLVPNNPTYIKRLAHIEGEPDFKPLIEYGFLEPAKQCTQMLADARPEKRRDREETETETETEKSAYAVKNTDTIFAFDSFKSEWRKLNLQNFDHKDAEREFYEGCHAKNINLILSSLKLWVDSEKWRKGFQPKASKFLSDRAYEETPAKDPELIAQEREAKWKADRDAEQKAWEEQQRLEAERKKKELAEKQKAGQAKPKNKIPPFGSKEYDEWEKAKYQLDLNSDIPF